MHTRRRRRVCSAACSWIRPVPPARTCRPQPVVKDHVPERLRHEREAPTDQPTTPASQTGVSGAARSRALGEMRYRPRTLSCQVAPEGRYGGLAVPDVDRAAEYIDPAPGIIRIVGVVSQRRSPEVAGPAPADREGAARVRPDEGPPVEKFQAMPAAQSGLRGALGKGKRQEISLLATGAVSACIKQLLELRQREVGEAVQVNIFNGREAARNALAHRSTSAAGTHCGPRGLATISQDPTFV